MRLTQLCLSGPLPRHYLTFYSLLPVCELVETRGCGDKHWCFPLDKVLEDFLEVFCLSSSGILAIRCLTLQRGTAPVIHIRQNIILPGGSASATEDCTACRRAESPHRDTVQGPDPTVGGTLWSMWSLPGLESDTEKNVQSWRGMRSHPMSCSLSDWGSEGLAQEAQWCQEGPGGCGGCRYPTEAGETMHTDPGCLQGPGASGYHSHLFLRCIGKKQPPSLDSKWGHWWLANKAENYLLEAIRRNETTGPLIRPVWHQPDVLWCLHTQRHVQTQTQLHM